ncbi:MAG: hypothetical protein ABL961_12620 [Vicinamibacterales bacterium]
MATPPRKNTGTTAVTKKPATPPEYEPPQLIKFDKLEKLIVSGE